MIPQDLFDRMKVDRRIRSEITKQSHILFFHFYFAHYVKYNTAPFQKEIFSLTENDTLKNIFIVAFRGSAKSTIVTSSYPIWAILGKQKRKFVLILTQTTAQGKQHLMNLKAELENNELLKNDLGPFREESDEWGSRSLTFPEHGARITVASTEQSIRGLRHFQNRPDLIIGDDLEDLPSCKTKEARDKLYQWFKGEVIPIGDIDTRLIIVGNLLHNDSLLMKIKKDIDENRYTGIFKQYPLLDTNHVCLWSGKFPTKESLQDLKRNIGNEIAWQREYLLCIIPDEDQIIRPEWITYYKIIPTRTHGNIFRYISTGVDLAISESTTADKTACVSVQVHGYDNNLKIYILPNPINRKMDFPTTLEVVKTLSKTLGDGKMTNLLIEQVGYQAAVPQMLAKEGYPATGVLLRGQDKRTRLNLTAASIQSGVVCFPERGCEDLIQQILGFGSEKHDDLVDAFTLVINHILEGYNNRPGSLHISKDEDDLKPITAGLLDMTF